MDIAVIDSQIFPDQLRLLFLMYPLCTLLVQLPILHTDLSVSILLVAAAASPTNW
jgi:hypothetical protein